MSWAPLYAAGTAANRLAAPRGAARHLEEGSQLLLQVHLFNTTDVTQQVSVEVGLELSRDVAPRPVGLTLFGATGFQLPPGRATTVTGSCVTETDLDVYAIFPHMHSTGRHLLLEAASPPETELRTVYERTPFDFDDQRFDEASLHLPAGSRVNIACSFENTSSTGIGFGESSKDEMCFAIGFTDGGPSFSFCSDYKPPLSASVPRDPGAGSCAPAASGVGEFCTRNGGECDDRLFCSADLLNGDLGLCFSMGCKSDDECGSGNTCCTLPNIGDIANLCLPEGCRPDQCIPTSRRPHVAPR